MKTLSTFLFLFIGIWAHAQKDANGTFIDRIENQSFDLRSGVVTDDIGEIEFPVDSARYLDELNLEGRSEAYPWISNDGLRIYYTLESEPFDVIVMAERASISDPFSDPEELAMNIESDDNFSCWLTDDELEIYFAVRLSSNGTTTSIYHSTRDNINDDFGTATQVEIIGNVNGFLSAPSFDSGLEHMYVYNANVVTNILILEQTAENSYTLADSLCKPIGYSIGPGILSSDNLKYYCGMSLPGANQEIHVASRESTADEFSTIDRLMNDDLNVPNDQNTQPSISSNGRYFAYQSSEGDSWQSNNLRIAYLPEPPVNVDELKSSSLVNVFPNPSSSQITFDLSDDMNATSLVIYSSLGEVLEQITLSGQSLINRTTEEYANGNYFFEIFDGNKRIERGTFIVRHP